jgi:phosphoglycerate dehydrogenase-like enzyme
MSRCLLFALSSADRHRFLNGRSLEQEFGPGARWVDVAGISKDDWQRLLIETAPEVLVSAWDTPQFPEELARSPDLSLRYVCHMAGGVRFLPRSLLERGVLVSNWGSSASSSVAEHALLMTLGALRSLPLWRPLLSNMPSDRMAMLRTRTLRRKRVGLHGFGLIARQFVGMARPFEPDICAYSAGVPLELFECHGVRAAASLEELFKHSEVLIECEALTALTRGSVTAALLDLLPEDAVFVNVGRGAVVDEEALGRRALEGRIRVALDVFEHEPLPADSAFLRTPNAMLSPHVAGPTDDTFALCGEFALSNLKRYFQGEKPEGLVTPEAYDRSS